MPDLPVAFRDLPADLFPLTMQLLDAETREVRWEQVIRGPGPLRIPSRAEINSGRVLIARITFADGSREEAGAGG